MLKRGLSMKNENDKNLYSYYLKRIIKENQHIFIWQISIFLLFIALWALTSLYHIIDPLLFSSPAKVISLLSEKLIDGSLLKHLVITLGETLIGFFIGTILGIGIATVLWLSEKTAKISDPY